jgi:hypothetical protein
MRYPGAIIFINNDTSDQVKEYIKSQLFVSEIITSSVYDTRVSNSFLYPYVVRGANKRIIVTQNDLSNINNKVTADAILFVKNGIATIYNNIDDTTKQIQVVSLLLRDIITEQGQYMQNIDLQLSILRNDILSINTELGVNPSGTFINVVSRLNAVAASIDSLLQQDGYIQADILALEQQDGYTATSITSLNTSLTNLSNAITNTLGSNPTDGYSDLTLRLLAMKNSIIVLQSQIKLNSFLSLNSSSELSSATIVMHPSFAIIGDQTWYTIPNSSKTVYYNYIDSTLPGYSWYNANNKVDFTLQTSWYIDSISGNDGYVGDTTLNPIKTFAELRKRISDKDIYNSVKINILKSMPETDGLSLKVNIHVGSNFVISGTDGCTYTAKTASSITQCNFNNNTNCAITVTGENFTNKQGTLLKFPNNVYAWVATKSSADVTIAWLSVPYNSDGINYNIGNASVITTNYSEVNLPNIYINSLEVNSVGSGSAAVGYGGIFGMEDVAIRIPTSYAAARIEINNSSYAYMQRVRYENYYLNGVDQTASTQMLNCYFDNWDPVSGGETYYGCTFTHAEIFPGTSMYLADSTFVSANSGTRYNDGLRVKQNANAYIANAFYYNATGSIYAGLYLENNAKVYHSGNLLGKNNTYSVKLLPGASLILGYKPLAVALTLDFLLAGSTTYRSWDDSTGTWSAALSNTWTNFGSTNTSNAHNVSKNCLIAITS